MTTKTLPFFFSLKSFSTLSFLILNNIIYPPHPIPPPHLRPNPLCGALLYPVRLWVLVPRVGLARSVCGGAGCQPPLDSTLPAPRCLHLSLAIHHNLYTRLSPPYTSPSIYTSPSTYTTPPPNTSPQCSPLPIVHLTPLPHLTPLATLHFCLALHQDANWAITTPGNSMALLYLFGNHGQGAWLYMDNNYTWQLYGSAVFIWQPWPEGIAAMGRRVVGASSFLRGRAGLGVPASMAGWGKVRVALQGGSSQSKTIGLPIPPPP